LQRYTHNGDIYDIKIYGDSTQTISTTPEHPFLYVDRISKKDRNKKFKPRWNAPKYFKKADYLVMPINNVVKTNKYYEFTIKEGSSNGTYKDVKIKVPLSKEFFRLVGYYLAEGSISGGYYLNFSFNKKERKYIEDVKSCIKKVFKTDKISETHHNNGTNVVISSVKLARIFEQLGKGSHNKQILPWMMYETKTNQTELIKAWFKGDGNYYNKKHSSGLKEALRINTTSYKLVRQARDILLRLGVFGFINQRNRSHEDKRTIYTLGITGEHMIKFGELVGIKIKPKLNNKSRASMFSVDEKFAYVPIKEVNVRKVKNMTVYNFGVDAQETYTVAGVAVHNCSAPVYNENSLHAGCVEVFVHKGARMRYSSVENWSINTYNLNTKRANVDADGIMEWVSGNLGSGLTMLYPASLLLGEGAKADHITIAYAGKNQNQDTGAKVYHLAPKTTSTINSKSLSKGGGIAAYRGLVKIRKGATNSKCSVTCDALMFDNKSQSNTYPLIEVEEKEVDMVHEASVGKISEEQLFYLQSRGLSEEQALQMIVSGFMEPLLKELPLEYAVEMNRLIELEMDRSLG